MFRIHVEREECNCLIKRMPLPVWACQCHQASLWVPRPTCCIDITLWKSGLITCACTCTHMNKHKILDTLMSTFLCHLPPLSPGPHLDKAASSLDGPSALSVSLANDSPGSPDAGSGPGAQPEWVDCIQASDMCNQNPYCSSRYRVMRQCLVGKEKEAMLDNNRECQAALEVLLVSPLYDCRCKRGMKKELQCLQNYWTIHMGLTEGRRQMVLRFSVS